MTLWVVVLAGGVGSRFWPVSTPTRPKQLLPLVTDKPLLADAVARLQAHKALMSADRLIERAAALEHLVENLEGDLPRIGRRRARGGQLPALGPAAVARNAHPQGPRRSAEAGEPPLMLRAIS